MRISVNTLPTLNIFRSILITALLVSTSLAHALDHDYPAWNKLLGKHVAWNAKGVASSVDYAGFAKDRAALKEVLGQFSAVSQAHYGNFSRDEKLAFLINAYNAFTVELILTEYPNLKSIKDLGSLFRSPWRKKFFTLLEGKRHLDWIEHDKIRASGVFNEPRIHFAINCASTSCPVLRQEAYVAKKLDDQLTDQAKQFLLDMSRNEIRSESRHVQLSKIFWWFREDFGNRVKTLQVRIGSPRWGNTSV